MSTPDRNKYGARIDPETGLPEAPLAPIFEYLLRKPDLPEPGEPFDPLKVAGEVAKHPIGSTLGAGGYLLEQLFRSKPMRALTNLEGIPWAYGRAAIESAKGQRSFTESLMDARKREAGGRPLTGGDFTGPLIPMDTPGRNALIAASDIGGAFLSPANALGILNLSRKGVAVQKFAESGKTIDQALDAAKMKGATQWQKDIARIYAEEGLDGLRPAKSTGEAIQRGHKSILSPRDPLKPFAPDAPVEWTPGTLQRKVESPIAGFLGDFYGQFKRTPVVSSVRQQFSNRAELPSDDNAGIHRAVTDRLEQARQESHGKASFASRKVAREALYPETPKDPIRRLAFRMGIGRKPQVTGADLEKSARLIEAPFLSTDPADHAREIYRRFGTTDDEALNYIIYDPKWAGRAESTVERIKHDMRVVDRQLLITPDDPTLLAMRQSQGHWLSRLEGTAGPLPPDVLPDIKVFEEGIKKIDKSINEHQNEMRALTARADDAMKRFEKSEGNVTVMQNISKELSEIEKEQNAVAKRLLRLNKERERGNMAIAQREVFQTQAAERVRTLTRDELSNTPAASVLPEVAGEVESFDKRALTRNARGQEGHAAYFSAKANEARVETLAERAKRLSGGDPMREEELLSRYIAEARASVHLKPLTGDTGLPSYDKQKAAGLTAGTSEELLTPAEVAKRKALSPKPNETYKASAPERRDGTTTQPPKPMPLPTDDQIAKSIEQNESVLDMVRRYSMNSDGTLDKGHYDELMKRLSVDEAARENMSRELANDVIRNVKPEHKKLRDLFQRFYDDYIAVQTEEGTLSRQLDAYINHVINDEKRFKGKGLSLFTGPKTKGSIPRPSHTRVRTLGETMHELADFYQRSGSSSKKVTKDLLELSGIYAKETEQQLAMKRAMEDLTSAIGVPFSPENIEKMRRVSPRAVGMEQIGGFTPDEIRRAGDIDRTLAFRERMGGDYLLGKRLAEIELPAIEGLETAETIPLELKAVLRGKHEGKTVADVIDNVGSYGSDPLRGMTREEIELASRALSQELEIAEASADLYPQFGIYISRYGLNNLAKMNPEELGEDAPVLFAAIQRMVESGKKGEFHYEVPDDVAELFGRLSEKDKVSTWLMPRQAATRFSQHVKSFTEPDIGDSAGKAREWLAAIRAYYSRIQLFPFTDFHVQNIVGNKWNTYFYGGQSISSDVKATKILFGDRATKYRNVWGDELTGQELVDLAEQTGSTQHGMFSRQNMDDYLSKELPIPGSLEYLRKVAQATENQSRFSYFLDQWTKGLSPHEASKKVQMFLHDYTDLTHTERHIRLAMPFYAFAKKQGTFLVREIAKRPYLASTDYEFTQAWQELTGEEVSGQERLGLPSYMDKMLYVKEGERGGETAVRNVGKYYPTGPIHDVVDRPVETAYGLVAPYITRTAEALLNRRLMTGTPIKRSDEHTEEMFGFEVDPRFAHWAQMMRAVGAADQVMFGAEDEADKRSKLQRIAEEVTQFKTRDYDTGAGFQRRRSGLDSEIGRVKSDARKKVMEGREIGDIGGAIDKTVDRFTDVLDTPPRFRPGTTSTKGTTTETPAQKAMREAIERSFGQ